MSSTVVLATASSVAFQHDLSLPLCVCLSRFVSGRQITRASAALASLLWVAGVCVEGNFCRHCAGFSDHYQPLWLCLCSRARSAGELTRCILPLRTARTKTGRCVFLCSWELGTCSLSLHPLCPAPHTPTPPFLLCPLHPLKSVHLLTKHQTAYYWGVKREKHLPSCSADINSCH